MSSIIGHADLYVPSNCVITPAVDHSGEHTRFSRIVAGPVVVIENRQLYGTKGPPVGRGHRVPLGTAQVVRPTSTEHERSCDSLSTCGLRDNNDR